MTRILYVCTRCYKDYPEYCARDRADGKARRIKPDLRLLVDRLPGRVGFLRILGNAIVPILAAEVLAALLVALAASTGTTHDHD